MFKNHIRERREEMGLSQVKLSCVCGMAYSTLNSLELGKLKPYPKAKRDISNALGVDEETLFPGEEVKVEAKTKESG